MDQAVIRANDTNRQYIDIPLAVEVIHLLLGIAILIVNLFVVIAYATDRDIRHVPANVYILNLSISDLVTGLGLLIRFFWAYELDAVVPIYENVPCLFLGAFYHASRVMSTLIVIEISLDRLNMVSNPFQYRQRTVNRAAVVSVVTWIVPVIYIICLVHISPIVAKLLRVEYEGAICLETQLPRGFAFLSFWGDFAVPFTILFVLNTLVIMKLRKATLERFQRQKSEYRGANHNVSLSETSHPSNTNIPTAYVVSDGNENTPQNIVLGVKTHKQDGRERGNGKLSSPQISPTDKRINAATKREFKKVYRAAAILKVFVGVYVICWIPFYIILGISHQNSSIQEWIILLASVIISFNSFINPILYTYMSRRFRRRFLLMLKCRKR